MLTLAACLLEAASQSVVSTKVHGRSLESGLLGDSPDRDVLVYLPPSYAERPERRFPVVYLLHGFTARATIWTDGFYQGMQIGGSADALMRPGTVQDMIIVMPDASTRLQGSWYVNSEANGSWDDFISQELVAWVDRTYRTVASRDARGIAGHSMGGYGALSIAMKHPDVFGAVYAMSPWVGALEASESYNAITWAYALRTSDAQSMEKNFMLQLSLSAAFSPDHNQPPWYADFPYELVDGRLARSKTAWDRWMAHDLVKIAAAYAGNLKSLRGLAMDCGTSDSLLPLDRILANRLEAMGIRRPLETYDGIHSDKIRDRVERWMLPFFSRVLSTGG
jgi:S-formylglutathione hydrolase FrmB